MITPAQQELFSRDFIMGLQQQGTKFRPYCQIKFFTEGTKAELFKQIGESEAQWSDTSNGDTPIMSTPMSHAWVEPREFEWGDLFEEKDIIASIGNPQGSVIQAGNYSMGRFLDYNVVVPALFGTAKRGEKGATSVVFPTDGSQDIAKDIGSGTAGTATSMNVKKIIDGLTLLEDNGVDAANDTIVLAMTGKEKRALLKDPLFTSKDYRDSAVYDNNGMLTGFLGVKFMYLPSKRANRSIDTLPVASSLRSCPMWAVSGAALGIWIDGKVEMGKDPAKKFNWRVYTKQFCGATRTDELKVARIFTSSDGSVV